MLTQEALTPILGANQTPHPQVEQLEQDVNHSCMGKSY